MKNLAHKSSRSATGRVPWSTYVDMRSLWATVACLLCLAFAGACGIGSSPGRQAQSEGEPGRVDLSAAAADCKRADRYADRAGEPTDLPSEPVSVRVCPSESRRKAPDEVLTRDVEVWSI